MAKNKSEKAVDKKNKSEKNQAEPKKNSLESIPNYGRCVTCKHFPHHVRGEAQPCKILKEYVARKAEHPSCYKCKFA